jgi:hypothetical protein
MGIAQIITFGYLCGQPMDFRTFYRQLTPDQREAFAAKVHTTVGYCHQIACGKRIELGLADAIVAVSAGAVTLGEINLTDRAKAQDGVRKGLPDAVPT